MQNNLSDDAFFYMCVLDGSGGCQDLNKNELANWKSEKGVLWLDLNYSHHTTQNWLRKKSGLEDIICEALLAEETRPRVVQYGKGLLIVLRGVNLNPGATPDDMVSIRIWTDENKIISTRLRHLLSIADMRELLEDHKGPVNSAEFIVELSRRLVWRMSDTIDNMEDLIAELEDKVLTAESAELRFDLSLLRRQIITLRRYLAPQRDALSRLNLQTVSWFGENNRIEIREIGDRLTRHKVLQCANKECDIELSIFSVPEPEEESLSVFDMQACGDFSSKVWLWPFKGRIQDRYQELKVIS